MKNPDRVLYDASICINPDTISLYAKTNEVHLTAPVQGILLELPGLGGGSCLGGTMDRGDYSSEFAIECGKKGIVLAYMFPGPWSWGNKAAIRMSDAVVSAIAKKYDLGQSFPLVVSGGSMGGVGALMFACDTAHDLTACVAACPCIDIPARMNAHPDFPRTVVSAVAWSDLPLEEALRTVSPLHRIADLPKIPYFICSDENDEVFPEFECDAFADSMAKLGYDITYRRQPGQGHGGFTPEVIAELRAFEIKHASKGE